MGKSLKLLKNPGVQYIEIHSDFAGQRIDNFLINMLKGVPKTKIYGIIRRGEVRVNKLRVKVFYRLLSGDHVRIPPIRLLEKAKSIPPHENTTNELIKNILYEDENILIINKPSGMSVHGGSTVRIGIVEALRFAFPKLPQLELVHRLDSETSGCLILAKKKRVLRELHQLLRAGSIKKIYWTLTKGKWQRSELRVTAPLQKNFREGGKHVVTVHQEGKEALSLFKTIKVFSKASLMEVQLMTGRTHQIRVHAQFQGHPIAADSRYGDPEFNKYVHKLGLKRLFLHAQCVDFILPSANQRITVIAPLPLELEKCMKAFATRDSLKLD